MSRWFAPAVVLFVSCFGTALLAWQASIPSRWLFAIFPPAGIALAGLLVLGFRYWPAAIAGSTFAFFLAAEERHHEKGSLGQIILFASVVGGLYTAQVLTGYALVRRWLGQNIVLTRPRDVFVFLAIAGPLQTFLPSLIGSPLTAVFGFHDAQFVFASAFSWWLIEVTGGFVFAIITLTLVGEPAEVWRPRRLTVAIPLLTAVGLFLFLDKAAPAEVGNVPESTRTLIEFITCLMLFSLTALLLVVTGRTAVVADDARQKARVLSAETLARRSTESALELSESRLAEAQSIARIGSWEWDTRANTVIWSDQMFRLLGYEPGSIPATYERFIACVHEDDRDLVANRMREAVENERPYEFDFRIIQPNGTVRILHAQAIIDRDDAGVPLRWRGTDQDVTERVLAEEARRRLDERLGSTQRWEALGQLAGGVAHDFNNLMAGVLGNATLAREMIDADSPVQEMLAPIEEAAHHAASLCQQLLAFAGKGVSARGAIDVQALVNESLELIRLGVPRTVDLRIGSSHDLPIVEGDRSQIKQVLLNLVWNATEAIGREPGVIEIRTGSSHGGCCDSLSLGHYCASLGSSMFVWLEVRDTGCGIPPEVLARMFDPFFTTKDMGRGLGLSAVAGIVRSHGGVCCVTSRPGVGTSLRVYFSAIDDEPTRRTPPIVNTPRNIPHAASRTVDAV